MNTAQKTLRTPIAFFLIATILYPTLHACCGSGDESTTAAPAPADAVLTRPTSEDKQLWSNVKKSGLIFEKDDRTFLQQVSDLVWQHNPYLATRLRVKNRLINEHNAQEVALTTRDEQTLSALFLHRPQAKITIVFATGYFANQTPTKEWAGPFAHIFPDCNLLMFDWRTYGDSTCEKSFSLEATNDVVAALSFCRNHKAIGHLPIVLNTFCLGGAISLEAMVNEQAKQHGIMPDAVSFSCMFSKVADIDKRVKHLTSNKVQYAAVKIKPIRRFLLSQFLDPCIEKLVPEERLTHIKIPCNFEYCAANDLGVPLDDGYINYHAALNAPVRNLIISQYGYHARLQGSSTKQYRNAHINFWLKAGLIDKATFQEMTNRSTALSNEVLTRTSDIHEGSPNAQV